MSLIVFSTELCAQSKDQIYLVQIYNVPLSKSAQYESAMEATVAAMHSAKVGDAEWYGSKMDDGRYIYGVPVDNYATLDGNYWKESLEKIGLDNFQKLTDNINSNITEQESAIYIHNAENSYAPEGANINYDGSYRRWTFYQFKHNHQAEVMQLAAELKNANTKHNYPIKYDIYIGGIGTVNGSIVVLHTANSEAEYVRKMEKFSENFPEELMPLHKSVQELTVDIDTVTGRGIEKISFYSPEG